MVARRKQVAFAIAIAIAAASAVAAWAGSDDAAPSKTSIASTASKRDDIETALGMSSCMAASCHGGAVREGDEAWKSSYTAWFTRDPHAKAYNDLFNARSRRMIAQLENSEMALAESRDGNASGHAYLKALGRHGCLACHAHQATADDALAATSLGCQDCHGADQGWVSEHYLAAWRQRSAADRRTSGMTDTKSLAERASACVGCHIGAPASENSPLRDMNHDLIAAGHPRLNFEFAAYLANLPPHWDQTKDHERLADAHGNFEAHAWIVGQQASASAALALLANRAERASAQSEPPSVWPEFSEYDCYGCHHQLVSPTTRPPREQRPGQWHWGTWHFALNPSADSSLAELKPLVERSSPDAAATARLAEQVRRNLPAAESATSLDDIIERLSAGEMRNWHWDQYAQWYLGLRALEAACREIDRRDNRKASAAETRLEELLSELEKQLKFADHADSPWNFDPHDAELKRVVDQLREVLPELARQTGN